MWKYCRAVKDELHIMVLLIILLFCSDFSYQMDLQLTSSDSSVAHNMCERAWVCLGAGVQFTYVCVPSAYVGNISVFISKGP